MIKILLHILAIAGTLLLIDQFIPGIEVANFTTAVIVAVLWGIISVTLRPILTILTLPITLITFGLFSLVINALLFWLLTFVDGFSVAGFIPAFIGALILSAVSWILHKVF